MPTKSTKDVYSIVTDRILSQLEEGTVPWHKPWSTGTPSKAVSKRPYSGVNLFLLPNAADHRWVSFKQARDLGGNVRKGEKSSMVVFWKMQETEDDDGKKKVIPILRYYNVFNVAQCEGLKLPALATTDNALIIDAESIVASMPNRPELLDGYAAFYTPSRDTVTIPALEAFVSSERYYSTLFHELTHSTGHASRLDRHAKDGLSFNRLSHAYSKEELVAEFGAAFLCATTGIDVDATERQSAAYIASWAKVLQSDKRLIVAASSRAQKAVKYIIGTMQEIQEAA